MKFTNANFPLGEDGRTYHVGTKLGETANKILTVGDSSRARLIANTHFDKDTPITEVTSKRGFLTLTGTYQKVPVSIVAIGMGLAMMDFFVREVRAVTEGPLEIIRFGSCGSISPEAKVGMVAVATGSACATRNYNHFDGVIKPKGTKSKPYLISRVVQPDIQLSKNLHIKIASSVGASNTVMGLNVTADSFYSSQARVDPRFADENQSLIEGILKEHKDAITLEMESFMLLHLASCAGRRLDGSKDPQLQIRAAAATMIFADRTGGGFITPAVVEKGGDSRRKGLPGSIGHFEF
ncbi:nucleoside phosphorylase domain-containing protein [Obelidium mucronatum]|nr:nucleoside phosphorylase domain-containing protein [Obelidium mucronatum]